jgi:hypothetical protein
MVLLTRFKEALYQRKLRQCAKLKKNRIASNFDDARNIGLIFDASNPTNVQTVLSYKKELQQSRKKVSLMGYRDIKELSGEEDYPCFCNKDLGFSMTPKGQEVLEFIEKPFDLLISLHTNTCLPLEYISAASSAHFRIGHYKEEKTDFYDFMIYGKSKSLRALIQQMETYLKKIH